MILQNHPIVYNHFPLLLISYTNIAHLSQLMKQCGTLLSSKVRILSRFPQCLYPVRFRVQELIQETTLLSGAISTSAPLHYHLENVQQEGILYNVSCWDLAQTFSWLDCSPRLWAKDNRGKLSFSSHFINTNYYYWWWPWSPGWLCLPTFSIVKLLPPPPFYCRFWQEVSLLSPHSVNEELCSISLLVNYLHKLFSFLV